MSLCFLNGDYQPLTEARVPVLDRGFIFGDGVYEVIPVYDGAPFRLHSHLARLRRSLAAIGMPGAAPACGWQAVINQLIQANGGGDQSVYIQVTRGVAPRNHLPAPGLQPTVFVMAQPQDYPEPAPITAVLLEDFRWQRGDIKATALLGSVMMRIAARDAGADDAILHRDGLLTEAAASNVFLAVDGVVHTPPLSASLLAGVTRDFILELLAELDVPVQVAAVPLGLLEAAEEIWTSSSTRELMPVVRLDERPVGTGEPGPLWRRVYAHYRERVRREARSAPAGVAS